MSYTDQVTVMRGHLEEFARALSAAYTYHAADDVRREAKNIGGIHQPSRLTTALESALGHAEGYLVPPEADHGTLPEA